MSANDQQMPAQLPPPMPPTPQPTYAPAVAAPRRSPGVAAILACFPGLGHLYLGLYQRGVAFFLAFAASIWMADHGDLGILIPFVWFFNVIDAYRQANLINQASATGVMPEPLQLPKSRGSLGFGVFLLLLGLLLLYNQFYPLDLTFLVDWWPMLLVLAGAYMLAKHFVEQKRQRDAELPSESV
jgi:hypothetical protein